MSISSQIEAKNPIVTPEKSENLAGEFLEIPACKIEDVDRALFNLFDKDLPLLYTHRNDTRRVPIVFATGERFALIARKKPLRDKSNALILPVISIMRSGFSFGNEIAMANAPDARQVIKKQISREDPLYQRLINKLNLQNSDDLATNSAFTDQTGQLNAEPGRIATRRENVGGDEARIQLGNVLDHNVGNNVYEIYEMPAPDFFMITYEVTLWTQYVQEMNNLLSAISGESHYSSVTSFRIETEKGYKFVAYFDDAVNFNNNFDDFSEEERLVRASFNVKVPGYMLGKSYSGSPNKIRRYISAPQISFDTAFTGEINDASLGIPSGKTQDYVLSDFQTTDDELPGQFIGKSAPLAGSTNRFGINVDANASKNNPASIGGFSSPQSSVPSPIIGSIKAPFAGGKTGTNIVVVSVGTTKQGETIFRQIT